jgi:hypothetical protein
MFGGCLDYQVYSDETWLWDGAAWTLATPQILPCARRHHAMTYDPTVSRVIMFGGLWSPPPMATVSSRLNDTWTWDGSTWVRLRPATSPPRVYDHALVHDGVRGENLLFGGATETGWLDETWTQ